tara:strand:+ start:945 stop:1106 length:162 start_codon:yes stop_codon:yes gene_type:complete
MDNMLKFLIGYMEDVHTRLLEKDEKLAAIVHKNLESLRKDLNEHVEFFPVDDK